MVGLGGVFMLHEGLVWHHVMPQFYDGRLEDNDQLNAWLHHFNMRAPICYVGTITSDDYVSVTIFTALVK